MDAPAPQKLASEISAKGLLATAVVGLVIWFIPTPSGLEPNAWHLFAIFVATIVGIIIKAAPMGALSVAAIALCATTQVLSPGNPDKSMSLALSPFIPSNTARAGGIVYPITKSICLKSGSHPEDPSTYRNIGSYLALTGYNMNLAVSVVFFTGAAPNAIAAKFAANEGVEVSWTGWFLAAAVPALVAVALVPLVVYVMDKPRLTKTPEAPKAAAAELKELGPMCRSE